MNQSEDLFRELLVFVILLICLGYYFHFSFVLHDFSCFNIKLAYTYWGCKKFYFLEQGCRTKKFEKP